MTYLSDDRAHSGAPATDERRASRRSMGCLFEVVETLVLTLLIYLVIHNFVAQPFEVEQSSMIPTIAPHEYVLIDKLTPRWEEYARGDIVVFQPPAGYEQGGVPFIKRVIGVPGDMIRLENGRVFVTPRGGNPTLLEEPYVATELDGSTVPTQPRSAEGTAEWTIVDGTYFMMGDNRQQSQDSRAFGPIAEDLITGRAWVRYFPLDRFGFVSDPDYGQLSIDENAGAG